MAETAIEQYEIFKQRYPESLLLFRLGDFWESFYDDAKTVAGVCGLHLTTMNHSTIPLAGFPVFALDAYLLRLIKAGHRVALCEKVTPPEHTQETRKRDIVTLITPPEQTA